MPVRQLTEYDRRMIGITRIDLGITNKNNEKIKENNIKEAKTNYNQSINEVKKAQENLKNTIKETGITKNQNEPLKTNVLPTAKTQNDIVGPVKLSEEEILQRDLETNNNYNTFVNNAYNSVNTSKQNIENAKEYNKAINENENVIKSKEELGNKINDERYAKYNYNVAQVENEEANKNILTSAIRGIKEGLNLFSPTENTSTRVVYDENGNKVVLPTLNQLRQEKTSQETNGIGKVLNDVAFNIGKQLPSIVVGSEAGQLLYNGSMVVNSLESAVNKGYTTEQALGFATFEVAMEQVTGRLLGFLPGKENGSELSKWVTNKLLKQGVNNDAIRAFVSNFVGEGAEEFTQEFIESFATDLFDGKTLKEAAKDTASKEKLKDAIYSFIVGGISGGAMGLSQTNSIDNYTANTGALQFKNENDANTYNEAQNILLSENTTKKQKNEAQKTIKTLNDDWIARVNERQKGVYKEPDAVKNEYNVFVNSANNNNVEVDEKLENAIKNIIKTNEKVNVTFDKYINGNGDFAVVDGIVTIRLNPNSSANDLTNFVLNHEIGHLTLSENTQNKIIDYAEKTGRFNEALQEAKDKYGDNWKEEFCADFFGKYSDDANLINDLKRRNNTLYENIKSLFKKDYKLVEDKKENKTINNILKSAKKDYATSNKTNENIKREDYDNSIKEERKGIIKQNRIDNINKIREEAKQKYALTAKVDNNKVYKTTEKVEEISANVKEEKKTKNRLPRAKSESEIALENAKKEYKEKQERNRELKAQKELEKYNNLNKKLDEDFEKYNNSIENNEEIISNKNLNKTQKKIAEQQKKNKANQKEKQVELDNKENDLKQKEKELNKKEKELNKKEKEIEYNTLKDEKEQNKIKDIIEKKKEKELKKEKNKELQRKRKNQQQNIKRQRERDAKAKEIKNKEIASTKETVDYLNNSLIGETGTNILELSKAKPEDFRFSDFTIDDFRKQVQNGTLIMYSIGKPKAKGVLFTSKQAATEFATSIGRKDSVVESKFKLNEVSFKNVDGGVLRGKVDIKNGQNKTYNITSLNNNILKSTSTSNKNKNIEISDEKVDELIKKSNEKDLKVTNMFENSSLTEEEINKIPDLMKQNNRLLIDVDDKIVDYVKNNISKLTTVEELNNRRDVAYRNLINFSGDRKRDNLVINSMLTIKEIDKKLNKIKKSSNNLKTFEALDNKSIKKTFSKVLSRANITTIDTKMNKDTLLKGEYKSTELNSGQIVVEKDNKNYIVQKNGDVEEVVGNIEYKNIIQKVRNNGEIKKSKFNDTMLNSPLIPQDFKDRILNGEITYEYKTQTNETSLQNGLAIVTQSSNLDDAINKYLKNEEKGATRTAQGIILSELCAENDDYKNLAIVTAKLQSDLTTSGQEIQMLAMMKRLTPSGMKSYIQEQLNNSVKIAQNGELGRAVKKYVEEHKEDFVLTIEEGNFINDCMLEYQKEGATSREKQIAIAKIDKMLSNKLAQNKTFRRKAGQFRTTAMLLNPRTLVRNILANVAYKPLRKAAKAVSTGVDKIVAKKTGVRTIGLNNFKVTMQSYKQGLKEAHEDWKLGIDTKGRAVDKLELNEYGSSFKDKGIGKAINRASNLCNYLLDLGDRPFYTEIYNNSIANQLKLNNTTEVTEEMINIATEEALDGTFQSNDKKLYKFAKNIRTGLNSITPNSVYGLGDFAMPIIKTSANLTQMLYEYSPLGSLSAIKNGITLNQAIKDGTFTAKQQHDFVMSVGKVVSGAIIMTIGGALSKAGVINVDDDDDKDKKNFDNDVMNKQKMSFNVKYKGNNYTFSFDWADPISNLLAISHDLAIDGLDWNTLDNATQQVFESSVINNLSKILSSDTKAQTFVNEILNNATSFYPNVMKQIGDIIDPVKRETYVKGETFKNAGRYALSKTITGRKLLTKSVNTLGEEKTVFGNLLGSPNIAAVINYIVPSTIRKENRNEIIDEINNVYNMTKDKAIMPITAAYSLKKNGEDYILSTKERKQFQETTGKKYSEMIGKLLNKSDYTNLSDSDKAEALKYISQYTNYYAKKQFGYDYDVDKYKPFEKYINDGNSLDSFFANKKLVTDYYNDKEMNTYNKIKYMNFGYDEYKEYSKKITEIKNKYTGSSTAVKNSRKKEIENYLNSLQLSSAKKLVLYKTLGGYSIKGNAYYIKNYLDSLDCSTDIKSSLYKNLIG